jgi:chromosome partitioning protein
MQPIGYIVLQHAVRLDRPVRTLQRWIERIPKTYHREILQDTNPENIDIKVDPSCLALLKNYQSLMPMAQEAHKPIFFLKPADGAIGAHVSAVQNVYKEMQKLAQNIAKQIGLLIS